MQIRTRRMGRSILLSVLFMITSGCSRERIYQNMYEGLKTRDQIQNPHPPAQTPPEPTTSYPQYKDERENTNLREI